MYKRKCGDEVYEYGCKFWDGAAFKYPDDGSKRWYVLGPGYYVLCYLDGDSMKFSEVSHFTVLGYP